MNIAAYAVPVGSGGVILGSGGNVYQVVHQNARPAEAQTVQIISGSQLQAINGQIVTKAIQQQQQQQEEEQQAAESAEAATVTTSQQQSGLTITPVSATAATAAPSSSAAARPQQTVAVAGVQPGQIIQVRTEDSIDFCYLSAIRINGILNSDCTKRRRRTNEKTAHPGGLVRPATRHFEGGGGGRQQHCHRR